MNNINAFEFLNKNERTIGGNMILNKYDKFLDEAILKGKGEYKINTDSGFEVIYSIQPGSHINYSGSSHFVSCRYKTGMAFVSAWETLSNHVQHTPNSLWKELHENNIFQKAYKKYKGIEKLKMDNKKSIEQKD